MFIRKVKNYSSHKKPRATQNRALDFSEISPVILKLKPPSLVGSLEWNKAMVGAANFISIRCSIKAQVDFIVPPYLIYDEFQSSDFVFVEEWPFAQIGNNRQKPFFFYPTRQ